MPTFPFLKLPPNLQDAIARELELLDLFLLSQCSKKSFDIVRIAQSKSHTPLLLDINIGYSSTITLKHFQDRIFEFEFYHKRDPEILDLENPRPYRVYGLTRTIDLHQEFERFGKFGCSSDLSSSEMFLFIAQIMKLFNAKISILDFHPIQMDCIKGLISIGTLTECELIFIKSGRVTHDEMTMILEGVQAKEWCILCRTDRGFSCKTKITADLFFLQRNSWINIANLLDCKQIDLRYSVLTNQDLNTFIRHWLNGTDRKLEVFCNWTHDYEDQKNKLDLGEIVKGLPAIPGTPKRQDATSYFDDYGDEIAYENGFDFKRSDGMLATVTVNREQYSQSGLTTFVFIVWHDPNPYLIAP